MISGYNMSIKIEDFIESVWTFSSNVNPNNRYHIIDMDNTKKVILNMMVDEPYFIGELDRQFGKSEMCLMYAVYMAMKNTNNKISLMFSDEIQCDNLRKRLGKVLQNLMIVKRYSHDAFVFCSESIIEFNRISDNTTHVIIDEAAHFSEEKLKKIMESIPNYSDIKILSSENKDNTLYQNLIKDKKFTYFRNCIEDNM
jgi:hypothetical protein